MKNLFAPILFLFCVAAFQGQAQTLTYDRDTTTVVKEGGKPFRFPWAGGLNFVQVSSIDMNLDGKKDLFVFDRTGNKIFPFIFQGGTDTINYKYMPEYAKFFPDLHDWVLLVDYDNDGKEDIFGYSNSGFAVYKNISSGVLDFQLIDPLVHTQTTNFPNLYVSPADIPAIADIDNDGDVDVLTFEQNGQTVEFHKNLSMETFGHADSLKFKRQPDCWGYFSENISNNKVTMNISCPYKKAAPDETDRTDHSIHSGSTVLALDMDGDNDKDLILGDISFPNLVQLTNGGTVSSALVTAQDTSFPSYDVPTDMDIFPASFYQDINHDGKRDLIVSANSQNTSENFKSVWYYKNTNTDNAPIFVKQTESLLQEDMIDLGQGANPAFFDYNADGLLDMIVGNYGYYEGGGNYKSKLALFKNVGTVNQPSFALIDRDYLGLSSLGLYNIYPTFGDMDGDGDKDMMIGDYNGVIHYYENSAGPGNPASFSLKQANYQSIDCGSFSAPQIVDVDNDNIPDLLMGERNGNLNLFPNLGTINTPMFNLDIDAVTWQSGNTVRYTILGTTNLSKLWPGDKLTVTGCTSFTNNGTFEITAVNAGSRYIEVYNAIRDDPSYDEPSGSVAIGIGFDENFGDVDVRQFGYYTGYSTPFLYKDSGKLKLLLGSESGYIYHYGNIDGNLSGTFTESDTTYMNIWEGERTTIAGADLNNDNIIDLVIGNYGGGLALFWGKLITGIEPEPVKGESSAAFVVFPNPAKDQIRIQWNTPWSQGAVPYTITDMTGKLLRSGTLVSAQQTIPTDNLAQGVYQLNLRMEDAQRYSRFVIGQ